MVRQKSLVHSMYFKPQTIFLRSYRGSAAGRLANYKPHARRHTDGDQQHGKHSLPSHYGPPPYSHDDYSKKPAFWRSVRVCPRTSRKNAS